MSQYDPNLDPNRVPPAQPAYVETVETVVVRQESNTGWWIAGLLSVAVLVVVMWVLFSRDGDDVQAKLDTAQAEAAQAVADADRAVVSGQLAAAQQGINAARADAAQARAEASQAASNVRAAVADRTPDTVIIAAPAPADTPPAQ